MAQILYKVEWKYIFVFFLVILSDILSMFIMSYKSTFKITTLNLVSFSFYQTLKLQI